MDAPPLHMQINSCSHVLLAMDGQTVMTPLAAADTVGETCVTRTTRILRCGFSTGTAATAAARGALRYLLFGKSPQVISVRLPGNLFLPIRLKDSRLVGDQALAPEQRRTFLLAPTVTKTTPLLPAGLLGPVKLLQETSLEL